MLAINTAGNDFKGRIEFGLQLKYSNPPQKATTTTKYAQNWDNFTSCECLTSHLPWQKDTIEDSCTRYRIKKKSSQNREKITTIYLTRSLPGHLAQGTKIPSFSLKQRSEFWGTLITHKCNMDFQLFSHKVQP